MQTFLPYADFTESARCLDNKRLGKQRLESKQIFYSLLSNNYGWQNHPAVKMWRGHSWVLLSYLESIVQEWVRRGFNNQMGVMSTLIGVPSNINLDVVSQEKRLPSWLGDPAFHSSHRSNLLRKDPQWYGQFGWTESPDLPYIWPVR